MTRSELRAEIEDGTAQAAKRAKVPPLEQDELDHLLDIFASRSRFTGVDIGDEVVLSYDGSGTPGTERITGLASYEQHLGADACELFHQDYSYKAVKTIVPNEQRAMQEAQYRLTIPVTYGAQTDLGRYSQPDGPCPNWAELLPAGRIAEARIAQEEAVEHSVSDVLHVAEAMWEAGADGLNFDTTGAAGDADFLSVLTVIPQLRAKYPDMSIEVGMASEFVLGMHGELEVDGTRLAGLWPAEQVRLVQDAGATIWGPAINVNTTCSTAWNVARAITLIKPAMAVARIPVHVNAGMGVGGVPMCQFPPIDAVSRVSRACVDILRMDGL